MSGEATSPRGEGRARILVVDDQQNMRTTTALLLKTEGHEVLEAAGGEEALAILSAKSVELMLADLKMEPMDGITLLQKAREVSANTQVVLMTAYGSIESAVEAMRSGAYDYLAKPFKADELLYRIRRALERGRLLTQVDLFTEEFNARHGLATLVARSPIMKELVTKLVRVALSDATVLVQGESGTGKELVARAIHAHSRRRTNPFVPVNCAAIPETLLESELFGHAKGAFTGAVRTRRGLFEEANGGTLFIDEVTETTQAFQTKLLRVLQDGEVRRVGESSTTRVDVRIVAATNRNIAREVEEKRFRQDLFYRLNVVALQVPPLRERTEDVPALAEEFLVRANARSVRPKKLTAAALEHLMGYSFPGNVRELENLIEQAAALSESTELLPEDLPLPLKGEQVQPANEDTSLARAVVEAEERAIRAAVARHPGNLAQVARELAVSPTTLWRKMKRLGLGSPSAG